MGAGDPLPSWNDGPAKRAIFDFLSRVTAAGGRAFVPVPERIADVTSNSYYDWLISQPYLVLAAQDETAKFLATFKEYPPSQRAASFSVDQIVEKMQRMVDGMSK